MSHAASGWATATGPRPDNQDRCAAAGGWALVSDGAGGHQGGGLAATLSVEAAASVLVRAVDPDPDTVSAAIAAAHDAVAARQATGPDVSDMAATLTVAVAEARTGAWLVGNVGDSPAWRIGADRIDHLTEDHNAAAALVRAGAISLDEARTHPGRHMITQAVGSRERPAAALSRVTPRPGDRLVLATDGMAVLPEAAIMEVVLAAPTPDAAAHALVEAALAAGTRDNVTVVVLVPAR
ncbi:MAG TPA: protein phosphatase 2C domain-containing protein [Acidimicrobiales bacterium]|nr:protein phosphatase 2C domain-containing protein [Acidimicrobiales bacterium]